MADRKVCDVWTNQVGGSNCPQVHMEVWITNETATKVDYDWYLYYDAYGYAAYTNGDARSVDAYVANDNHTGSININGITGTELIASGSDWLGKYKTTRRVDCSVSFDINVTWSGSYASTTSGSGSFTLDPITSYKITYNANGGTGAPSSQTKWHDEALTLSSTKPTKTGYTFQGWATSSNSSTVSYNAGAVMAAGTNGDTTLYAVWKAVTYTVSYNANGGTGAPASQTKTHGVTLKLQTGTPTRNLYTFKGWGTSAGSTTVAYQPGANYTTNAAITLYAIWELAWIAPRIENISLERCTSTGVASEEGTYYKISFDWASDRADPTVKVEHKLSTSTSWTTPYNAAKTGTSGKHSGTYGGGGISIECIYDVRITVTDSVGSSTRSMQIASFAYPIDFKSGGKGVAFGKACTTDNLVDSAWPLKVAGDGTFTGALTGSNLKLKIGSRTREPVKMLSGDSNGDGILMQAGGVVMIGSGESATAFNTAAGITSTAEDTYILSDEFVYIVTGMQEGYSNRKTFTFNDSGQFKAPGDVYSGTYNLSYDSGLNTLATIVKYRKIGKVVYVSAQSYGNIPIPSGSYKTIATLPNGFRPALEFPLQWDAMGSAISTATGYIGTDGTIQLYQNSDDTYGYWRFSVAFPVA